MTEKPERPISDSHKWKKFKEKDQKLFCCKRPNFMLNPNYDERSQTGTVVGRFPHEREVVSSCLTGIR